MNKYNVDNIRKKLFDAIDDSIEDYTMDDFNKEFSGTEEVNIPSDMKIQLPFSNDSDNKNPRYETDGASGFDLRANLKESITLNFGERALIPTGLKFEIPKGFEIQVRPRSGLALKKGITVLNTPGTVDSDYRGDVGVILINLGQESVTINSGDRIAQGVLSHVNSKPVVNMYEIDSVSKNTDRGSGGFGSTGNK